VRVRDGVALFNLCSAVPTAPHLATGRLGQAQLDRLDALLGDPAYRDAFRVLLIHHPPVPGAVSKRKSLEDQDALRALLARHGADLVLHGHAHEAMVSTAPGPDGAMIPVLGVPSASAMGERGHPGGALARRRDRSPGDGGIEVKVVARGAGSQDRPDGRAGPLRPVQAGRPAASAPVAHLHPQDRVARLGREPRGLERRRADLAGRVVGEGEALDRQPTALRSKSRLALAS
jgi:hypothetical protein